ncbi:hypothetical protein DFH05DRAFT_1519404 [Lentinula detonsa]|uniref:DUF6532 domain-containing protein n=1 Tax=Lentinula detonsa TaxID=2804962 RepID=A0A9W8PCS0_9AGAR|nr:hypothetical protein DFH05DRAFT_1519404 [Lentinula detonsa]
MFLVLFSTTKSLPSTLTTARPKRKAAQNAMENSVWYAAEHRKRPALGSPDSEEPASNKAKTRTSSSTKLRIKKVSKVVPVSSDESEKAFVSSGESEKDSESQSEASQDLCQAHPSRSNNRNQSAGAEDIDTDSQYVPPRRRSSTVQDCVQDQTLPGSLSSSSPDAPSLLSVNDFDGTTPSIFSYGGNRDNDNDMFKNFSHGSHTHSMTRTHLQQPLTGRALKFAQEVPEIKTAASKHNKPVAASPRSWSPETEYNPPGVGQRLISLRAQSPQIQQVLARAVTTSIGLFLIKDAYPDVAQREKFLHDALVSAATEIGLKKLAERLCDPNEHKWRKFLTDYVFNRVVHVRSDVKKHAESIILDSKYPITGRLCDVPCYISFITLKLRYIFPLKAPPSPQFDEVVVTPAEGAETTPIATKRVQRPHIPNYTNNESLQLQGGAYRHPAIITTLRSMFSGPTSPGQLLKGAFSSSLNEDQFPDSEPEVPMSMVALAAAAVHFCLSEWTTGSLHSADFRGDKARPEYHKNIELLQKIQKDNPLRYHTLMSNLLTQAMESNINGSDSDGIPDVY